MSIEYFQLSVKTFISPFIYAIPNISPFVSKLQTRTQTLTVLSSHFVNALTHCNNSLTHPLWSGYMATSSMTSLRQPNKAITRSWVKKSRGQEEVNQGRHAELGELRMPCKAIGFSRLVHTYITQRLNGDVWSMIMRNHRRFLLVGILSGDVRRSLFHS